MMDYLLFASGLALLVYGGDRLVASSVRLALAFGLSTMVIGAVVIGLGTSAPELVTSIDAALLNLPGLALGNVIGSNIANLTLILGLAAVILPLSVEPREAGRDIAWLLVGTAAVVYAVTTATVERWMGVVLIAMLVIYIFQLLRSANPARADAAVTVDQNQPEHALEHTHTRTRDILWVLGGLILLVAGAHLMIKGAIGIAEQFGLSEAVTGLLLLAIGTSLPELTVTAIALIRREAALAIGNALGSTLFNSLGILGVTAVIVPLDVPSSIMHLHIWIMTSVIVMLSLFLWTGCRLSQWEGAILLTVYPAYIGFIII